MSYFDSSLSRGECVGGVDRSIASLSTSLTPGMLTKIESESFQRQVYCCMDKSGPDHVPSARSHPVNLAVMHVSTRCIATIHGSRLQCSHTLPGPRPELVDDLGENLPLETAKSGSKKKEEEEAVIQLKVELLHGFHPAANAT